MLGIHLTGGFRTALRLGVTVDFIKNWRDFLKVKKGKGAHESKAQTAGAYPGFLSMKLTQEYCYSPPGRDASPSQGYDFLISVRAVSNFIILVIRFIQFVYCWGILLELILKDGI